ncbi:MAG: flagellar hook-basal body complex protein, partial [Lawsonibacter sp.]|nr:flagellar hook-basal body complex protein [Lawsonibacter sp.]
MTGAMYAAIGGLRSHMSKLNVIGNNIANVNTFGYKSQRMTFKESIYGTTRSGSNGGVTAGGNNPSQVGYGCSVGTIDLNMSPSTYSPTGVDLDCYIDGDGFFMVGDKLTKEVEYNDDGSVKDVKWTGGVTSGEQLKDFDLTRVGDFWVDPDGYVCNGDGKIVYGYARVQNPNYVDGATKAQIQAAKNKGIDIESETIISTHLVPLRVPLQAAAPTRANGGVKLVDEKGNIKDPQPDPTQDYDLQDGESWLNVWEEGDPVYPFLNAEKGGLNQYADPELQKEAANGSIAADGTVTGVINKSHIPVAENTASDAVSNVMPVQLRNMSIGKDGSIVGTANGKNVVLGY